MNKVEQIHCRRRELIFQKPPTKNLTIYFDISLG